jgi:preprotein translocase subunit SecA
VAETGALASALLAEQGTNIAPQTAVLTAPSEGNGKNGGGRPGAKTQIRQPAAPAPDTLVPVVKQQHEKVGRNDPCWCGSGKKYKFCHGAA